MKTITRRIYSLLSIWNREGYSSFSINSGYCYIFASQLERKFPRGRVMWGEDNPREFVTDVDPSGHCFFKYGKRYYDSEAPQGVNHPDLLPFYKRQRT